MSAAAAAFTVAPEGNRSASSRSGRRLYFRFRATRSSSLATLCCSSCSRLDEEKKGQDETSRYGVMHNHPLQKDIAARVCSPRFGTDRRVLEAMREKKTESEMSH